MQAAGRQRCQSRRGALHVTRRRVELSAMQLPDQVLKDKRKNLDTLQMTMQQKMCPGWCGHWPVRSAFRILIGGICCNSSRKLLKRRTPEEGDKLGKASGAGGLSEGDAFRRNLCILTGSSCLNLAGCPKRISDRCIGRPTHMAVGSWSMRKRIQRAVSSIAGRSLLKGRMCTLKTLPGRDAAAWAIKKSRPRVYNLEQRRA